MNCWASVMGTWAEWALWALSWVAPKLPQRVQLPRKWICLKTFDIQEQCPNCLNIKKIPLTEFLGIWGHETISDIMGMPTWKMPEHLLICCIVWRWLYEGFPSGAWNFWTKKGLVSLVAPLWLPHRLQILFCPPVWVPFQWLSAAQWWRWKDSKCSKIWEPGYICLPTNVTNMSATVSNSVPSSTVITADTYKNGPVEGAFPVYEDLQSKLQV